MTGTKFFDPESLLRILLRWLIGAFLVFPFFIWLTKFSSWQFVPFEQWGNPLFESFVQAGLSSALCMIGGGVLFFGLQSLTKFRWLADLGLLLPNMIPPLFIVIGLINLVSVFLPFPYGAPAVIVVHALLNSGLVAIALDGLVWHRLGKLSDACLCMGASKWKFFAKVAWPILKLDLAYIFLFVFSLCFTSYSIPVLIGGLSSSTLEVAIDRAIRLDGRWDKAILFALIEMLVLFILAYGIPNKSWPQRVKSSSTNWLGIKLFRYFIFVPSGLIAAGWLLGFWKVDWFEQFFKLSDQMVLTGLTTLSLGLGVGVLTLIFLLMITYISPNLYFGRFLNGYLAPSPVLTGFACLFVPIEGQWFSLIKLMCALTLISLPVLYRWIIHSELLALDAQVRVARSLGANWYNVGARVVWPQLSSHILKASGLAALWASGDFALSSIVLEGPSTLPLLIDGLIANYNFEAAQLMLVPLALLGGICYMFFVRISRYVID